MTTLQQAKKIVNTALKARIEAKVKSIFGRMTNDELTILAEIDNLYNCPAWFIEKWEGELAELGDMEAQLRGIL